MTSIGRVADSVFHPKSTPLVGYEHLRDRLAPGLRDEARFRDVVELEHALPIGAGGLRRAER